MHLISILLIAFMAMLLNCQVHAEDILQIGYKSSRESESIAIPLYIKVGEKLSLDAIKQDLSVQEITGLIDKAFASETHELDAMILDVGDGLLDKRKNDVGLQAVAMESGCGDLIEPNILDVIKCPSHYIVALNYKCEKIEGVLRIALPFIVINNKCTLASELFLDPTFLLIEAAIGEGYMVSEEQIESLDLFDVENPFAAKFYAKIYAEHEFTSDIEKIAQQYTTFWESILAMRKGDLTSPNLNALKLRFNDTERLEQSILNCGFEKWLSTMPKTGRIVKAIDASPLIILVTDDYCGNLGTTEKSLRLSRRRFLVEILKNDNEWKIYNHLRSTGLSMFLSTDEFQKRLCEN